MVTISAMLNNRLIGLISDKDMHKLYKRFSEHNSNVIMLFTAHHPSWVS